LSIQHSVKSWHRYPYQPMVFSIVIVNVGRQHWQYRPVL